MCICKIFASNSRSLWEIIKEKPSMTHTGCKYNCTCLYLGCVCMNDHLFMAGRLQAVSSQEHNNKNHVGIMSHNQNQYGKWAIKFKTNVCCLSKMYGILGQLVMESLNGNTEQIQYGWKDDLKVTNNYNSVRHDSFCWIKVYFKRSGK